MTLLESPAPSLSEHEASGAVARLYGLEALATQLVSERDQNFALHCSDGKRFVLKISNASEDPAVIDFEVKALEHIRAQAPDLPVPRVLSTREGGRVGQLEHGERIQRVRLLTYLQGKPIASVPASAILRGEVGVVLARLARALRGFFHPAAGRELLWDLKHALGLRRHLGYIEDLERRRLAGQVLRRFESRVLPYLAGVRAQVVHNDLNPDNVLVDSADPVRISGIIDFGDMVHTALVNDLAVALAYQLFDQPDPATAAAELVAGYHSVLALEESELSLLLDLVATRLAVSGIISSWRAGEHPENRDYILCHEPFTWRTLETLMGADHGSALNLLRETCGLERRHGGASDAAEISTSDLRSRRERFMAPGLGLFYEPPLHLVRGQGVWLYDTQGRAYLDAYNNVAHVGHAHPKINAALIQQARLLNTNTRYLHRHIVDYAERLAAAFPGALEVCMFVCSGSEANDLAWRLACSASEGSGVVVTENAYHGNTTTVSQFSPEELPPGQRTDWVATVPAPNGYSGGLQAGEAPPDGQPAVWVDGALEALESRGHRPAAFFFDSIFTSDGIHFAPKEYLQAIFERIRAAGGLCVADEVQAGFGRTGDTLWCFQRYGVRPDIVTLGKPMGNGHPLAAVVTTPDIARSFSRKERYFNTFGGNPVSCAVGLALMEVLEEERLQERAATVGAYLREGLDSLMREHPLVAEVRGCGMFFGLELADDTDTRTPASAAATKVLNEMRQRGVLIGRTGSHGQVLKIRPPMVFSRDNADQLVDTLDTVMRGIC